LFCLHKRLIPSGKGYYSRDTKGSKGSKGKGYYSGGSGKGYYSRDTKGSKGKGSYSGGSGKGSYSGGSGKGYYSGGSGKGYYSGDTKGSEGKGYYSADIKGKGSVAPPPKGKGAPPPKGKGAPPPEGKGKGAGGEGCYRIPVLFFVSEIEAAEYTNSIGFGLDAVPFYNPETGEQLGVYSDFATETPGGTDECLVTGAFSFGVGVETYQSQIELQFTCTSEYNAIVGGTGEYGCASGYE